MHILMVNDDGIGSPELHEMCRAAAARGHRVTVCAPATQQSAKSHCFTINEPLLVERAQVDGAEGAWAVHGTPVDSCRLGLMQLAQGPVDLVMSGVNQGYNAGLAVFVSGTVGAAREAAFQRIPAMSVSQEKHTPPETARRFADYAVRLGEKLVSYPMPELSVCNINVPPIPPEDVKEARMCPISRNIYKDSYEHRVSPRRQDYYWLAPLQSDDCPTPGSDMDLLDRGHITVTFLTPDGCDQQAYADLPQGVPFLP